MIRRFNGLFCLYSTFILNIATDKVECEDTSMNVQEFETQYRDAMAETLDELQTAVLLLAQVQRKINQIGSSVQSLSQSVEDYITNQTPN